MKSLIVVIFILGAAGNVLLPQSLKIAGTSWGFTKSSDQFNKPGFNKLDYLPQRAIKVVPKDYGNTPHLACTSKIVDEDKSLLAPVFSNLRNPKVPEYVPPGYYASPFFNFNKDIIVVYRLIDYPGSEIHIPPLPVGIYNSRMEAQRIIRFKPFKNRVR